MTFLKVIAVAAYLESFGGPPGFIPPIVVAAILEKFAVRYCT